MSEAPIDPLIELAARTLARQLITPDMLKAPAITQEMYVDVVWPNYVEAATAMVKLLGKDG